MTCQLLPIWNNLLQRAMPYSLQLTILSHTLYKQIGLFIKFDVANIDNLLAVKTSCIVYCVPFINWNIKQAMQERQRMPEKYYTVEC